MTDDKPTPAAPAYPMKTKVIVVVVLTVAIGMFVLAGARGNTGAGSDFVVSGGNTGEVGGTEGVEAVVPARNAQLLNQEQFGIDLFSGWTGELALEPASGPIIDLPRSELIVVPELDQYFFKPGPDRILERLPQGTNCARATIWNQIRGREASERVERWCFTVF